MRLFRLYLRANCFDAQTGIMYTYRSAIILLLSSLAYINCSGQESKNDKGGSTSAVNFDSIEAQIIIIRKEYNRINADISKFRVVEEDLDDQSTEGGKIKKYYEDKSLRKAQLIFFGERGRVMIEYYFLNREIFFSFKRNYYYNIPMYEKGSKVSKIEEERFYFNNQKLIRWIGPNGNIVGANLYPTKEKEIVKDLNEDVYRK
jgi:hypothetical protein